MGSKSSRTMELWRKRVLAQRVSGQSVRGWCRANDCPEHGFYCWRAKLGLSPVSVRRRRRVPRVPVVGFARVRVEPPVAESLVQPLRLTLLGGRELALPASMPVESVARLIRAIEAGDPNTVAGQGAA